MKEIRSWKTRDGKLFDKKPEAEAHEAFLILDHRFSDRFLAQNQMFTKEMVFLFILENWSDIKASVDNLQGPATDCAVKVNAAA